MYKHRFQANTVAVFPPHRTCYMPPSNENQMFRINHANKRMQHKAVTNVGYQRKRY